MAEQEHPTVTLSAFDSHGTARARWRGQWLEVEHGIPGEVVQVEITGAKRRRGRIVEVVEPSPDRVEAPCIYFREWSCGGCQWQHISYPGQISRKCEAVEAAMREAGLDLAAGAVHALEDPWRYRWSAGISLGKSAGFRRHGSLAIVPIRDCPISHPLIGQLMAALNDAISAGSLPDYRGRVRLDVRVAERAPDPERVHVVIRPDREYQLADAALKPLLTVLAGMDFTGHLILARPSQPPEVLRGDVFFETELCGRPLTLAAPSFFQTNLDLLERLVERLQEEASPFQGKRVLDAYGGMGVLGLFLAEYASEVLILEADPLAIEAGRRTAAAWRIENVRFVDGRAEDTLPTAGLCDLAILDPPRTGLSPVALDGLLGAGPSRILYVSCLAASLARDLRALSGAGFQPRSLELFDFYPQTYHVELLAVLDQANHTARGEGVEADACRSSGAPPPRFG